MPSRRLVRAAAVMLLALPLAACSLKGEAWVDADTVRLDVTVAYATHGPMTGMALCAAEEWQYPGVTITMIDTPVGTTSCRVVGEMAQGELARPFGRVTVVTPEHLLLRVPGDYFSTESAHDDLDLTLHFPGEVLAASAGAHVQGASVTWIDPDALRTDGLSVTARARADLPAWLLPGLAGLAWGAALAFAARWLLPRPKRDTPDATTADAPAPTNDHEPGMVLPQAPIPDLPAEDPSVWADDA